MAKELTIRHLIIPLSVINPHQVISIRERIPAHLKKCVGISLSVSDYPNTRLNKVNHLAKVTLRINNNFTGEAELLLSYSKDVKNKLAQAYDMLTPLLSGEVISGVFIDNNQSIGDDGQGGDEFMPYKVNIILTCLTERK